MPQPEVVFSQAGALREGIEEGDALPDQLDLFRVVELEPEAAGRDRRGQGRQRRAFFDDDGAQTAALRKESGGAADDPAADDDEVRRPGNTGCGR